MLSSTDRFLLSLVQSALGSTTEGMYRTDVEWTGLVDMAFEQGVSSLSVDGYNKLINEGVIEDCPLENDENLEDLKFEWFGSVLQDEEDYRNHCRELIGLADVFKNAGLKMMLLKGYGLAQNYPKPAHREMGDIDIYLYGRGSECDKLVNEKFDIECKQNEDKHSTFLWNGITVENHACIINEVVHPYLKGLEDFFERDAENAVPYHFPSEENLTIYFPSPMTNALFMPFHIAGHFVHGEASLRQLCDWACFLKCYGKDINWERVGTMVKEYGYYPFYCCLNGVVKDYLGVPKDCLPCWDVDKEMEEKVLTEILHPKYAGQKLSLAGKVKRYFSNGWKYKMVYTDSMLLISIRLAKSYIRLHDKGAKSIWEIR